MAEIVAVQGRTQEPLVDRLERAIGEGYSNYIWIKVDANFANLHDEPRLRELLAAKRK